jgi:hypothetical protein
MAALERPVIVPATSSSPASLRRGSAKGPRLQVAGVCVWGVPGYDQWHAQHAEHQWKGRTTVIDTIRSWGANLVRLRLDATDYNGQKWGLTKQQYLDRTKEWVDLATKAGMYTQICWWDSLSQGSAWPGRATEAFDMMAKVNALFKDNPAVIYEPFNEPNNVTWAQWTPSMKAAVSHWRSIGYRGVLAINTIHWSHSYDDGRMSELEAHDAAQPGMNGTHQLMFCRHDYANEFKDKKWDRAKWIADNGGTSTKHVMEESEFGNYNGTPDTVSEQWTKDACAFFASRFKDSPNFAGAIPFLFGPWFDVNALTDGSNVKPTSWGVIARDQFLRSVAWEPEPQPETSKPHPAVADLRAKAAALRASADQLDAVAATME